MTKMLVFDMDGTIADLYGIPNWLKLLQEENTAPYWEADPIVDIEYLSIILNELKDAGWKIAITSWTSKGGSKAYNKAVAVAKKGWLDMHGFPYDELHIVKYGTTKANCTRKKADFQILVDDNDKILDGWTLGAVIKADKDLIGKLLSLKKLFQSFF